MKLRDYQQVGVDAINQAHASLDNVLYVLPCRGGKTAIVADIILHNKGGTVAIAHRTELVRQMSNTLARNGVYHRIIGAGTVSRECSRAHLREYGHNYINPNSPCAVASVDTLVRMDPGDKWFDSVTLWVCDESHHLAGDTKWKRSVGMFNNARGLGVTATPLRSDGKGLGRHADGVFDTIIKGPTHGDLQDLEFLAPFRIYAPSSDIDLSAVPLSAGGDYSPKPLAGAVHKSHITGDVVDHYKRLAMGKMGMTFCVDVAAATEQAEAFNRAGVSAAVVSANTPDDQRVMLQRKHQAREIMQLCNVDLFGEGVDIPCLEVVSMARPTQSFGLFYQQFCRPLNPIPDKYAIIIDHVGNVAAHSGAWMHYVVGGNWSLDRQERRSRTVQTDVVHVRTCPECFSVYLRVEGSTCPFCGHVTVPSTRTAPEMVDGDLQELSFETIQALTGAIHRPLVVPYSATPAITGALRKHHAAREAVLKELQETMAEWAAGMDDTARAQRLFYITFGVDVLTCQTWDTNQMRELICKIH